MQLFFPHALPFDGTMWTGRLNGGAGAELDRCGHYPLRERAARDEFLRQVREWLARFARTTDAT